MFQCFQAGFSRIDSEKAVGLELSDYGVWAADSGARVLYCGWFAVRHNYVSVQPQLEGISSQKPSPIGSGSI